MESYFTSTLVKKRLFNKTNTLLSDDKIKKDDISKLLNQIKNYKLRYKKI